MVWYFLILPTSYIYINIYIYNSIYNGGMKRALPKFKEAKEQSSTPVQMCFLAFQSK